MSDKTITLPDWYYMTDAQFKQENFLFHLRCLESMRDRLKSPEPPVKE